MTLQSVSDGIILYYVLFILTDGGSFLYLYDTAHPTTQHFFFYFEHTGYKLYDDADDIHFTESRAAFLKSEYANLPGLNLTNEHFNQLANDELLTFVDRNSLTEGDTFEFTSIEGNTYELDNDKGKDLDIRYVRENGKRLCDIDVDYGKIFVYEDKKHEMNKTLGAKFSIFQTLYTIKPELYEELNKDYENPEDINLPEINDLTDEDNNAWVSQDEYLFEYQNRMDKQIAKTRRAAIKQTNVRFGVLDKNKDGQITPEEYQLSGDRSFNRWDSDKNNIVSMSELLPEPKEPELTKKQGSQSSSAQIVAVNDK